LNIPTRADVDSLTQRIGELEAQLQKIEQAASKRRSSAAKSTKS